MSKRFVWVCGAAGVLVSIGLLLACGTAFNPSSDGLIVVGSQGSGLLETFSFSLSSGHNAAISNPPADTSGKVCVLNGLPSSIVIDPAGAFAYSIINANSTCSGSSTGIQAFKINSDGTISVTGSPVTLNPSTGQVCQSGVLKTESVPVFPIALTMDSSGKYLFVVNGMTTDGSGNSVPGAISVLAVGSGGALTEVTNTDPTLSSPFTVPPSCAVTPDFSAFAVTPTVLPSIGINGSQNPSCAAPGQPAPTSEFLYVADRSNNNSLWEFAIDQSSGALTPLSKGGLPISMKVGAVPSGVAVDPCDRFAYVTNQQDNTVSAFSICNGLPTQSTSCLNVSPGILEPVTGSPFSITSGNGPGPLLVDPFGNFVYVLDTLSSQVSSFRIGQVSGALTSGGITAAGVGLPISIAIRGDDNWLFVTNSQAASVSQYSITPSTGVLTPLTPIPTDNLPWGIAVK